MVYQIRIAPKRTYDTLEEVVAQCNHENIEMSACRIVILSLDGTIEEIIQHNTQEPFTVGEAEIRVKFWAAVVSGDIMPLQTMFTDFNNNPEGTPGPMLYRRPLLNPSNQQQNVTMRCVFTTIEKEDETAYCLVGFESHFQPA